MSIGYAKGLGLIFFQMAAFQMLLKIELLLKMPIFNPLFLVKSYFFLRTGIDNPPTNFTGNTM
jgi:hypothetical protein